MSLLNDNERRNLASVGTTHAASLLAQFTQTPAEQHQSATAKATCGQQIHRPGGDGVLRFHLAELSQQQIAIQLCTKQISKPADKGPSSTIRPLAIVRDFLSYVLKKKNDTGMVRALCIVADVHDW